MKKIKANTKINAKLSQKQFDREKYKRNLNKLKILKSPNIPKLSYFSPVLIARGFTISTLNVDSDFPLLIYKHLECPADIEYEISTYEQWYVPTPSAFLLAELNIYDQLSEHTFLPLYEQFDLGYYAFHNIEDDISKELFWKP